MTNQFNCYNLHTAVIYRQKQRHILEIFLVEIPNFLSPSFRVQSYRNLLYPLASPDIIAPFRNTGKLS